MIPRASRIVLFVLIAGFAGSPGAGLTAQALTTSVADLTIGGRLQVQYANSSVDDAVTDVFVRRARVRVGIRVADWIDARVEPELSGGAATLQDAWVRLAFGPAFRISGGQLKRAFSLFELSSSTDLPAIERDGRIDGVDACAGVGGACTFSRLTERLEFDGRDVGLRVDGTLSGGVSYVATLTNGEGVNRADVNDGKSFSGRLEFPIADGVSLGGFFGAHDHLEHILDGAPGTGYATAGGMDLEVGSWRSGFHLLAGAVRGENWELAPEGSFTSVQALGSWYLPTEHSRVAGVEPLLRMGWADPNSEAEDDGGILLTPGLMVYFVGKNGVSANVDVFSPAGDDGTEWSLKIQSYLYF